MNNIFIQKFIVWFGVVLVSWALLLSGFLEWSIRYIEQLLLALGAEGPLALFVAATFHSLVFVGGVSFGAYAIFGRLESRQSKAASMPEHNDG